jgi:hypothetical protein
VTFKRRHERDPNSGAGHKAGISDQAERRVDAAGGLVS